MGVLAGQVAVQASFDELGTPLREVTFVVVDLETTGGSPQACEITEIGAVKVRGGEVLGEFQTLVDPGVPIPPFISVLTGITDAMVAGAPRLGAALPGLPRVRRRHGGTVLVAHNAPFDMGFLKAACARTGTSGRATRCSTPRGWPAVCSPATRRPTASCPPWRGSSGPPPTPTTARSPTRAPRSTCCTGCSSGSAPSACTRSTS